MKRRILISIVISVWLAIAWFSAIHATEVKLTADDGAAGDNFGWSVSISGDYAIVGSCGDDSWKGSAYIFKRDGTSWGAQTKLLASDGAANDEFGYSVSISGDYAIVGAPYDDAIAFISGSAYIFKRNGTSWLQQAKLTASDGSANDEFGWSVSISGDYTIVGAYLDDDNGDRSGSAYIFYRNEGGQDNWGQQAKLLASDGADDDEFGCSVSISGDYAIVGAHMHSPGGSAYIFKRNDTSWTQETKLTANDGLLADWFGVSVSISGAYALVGAYGDDDNGENSGSAYIFKRNSTSWSQQAKLLASDGAEYDYFGKSVSISGDYAIVGAFEDDDNGTNSGSAYAFLRSVTSWSQTDKQIASDGAEWDEFGWSVSISGDYAIVGAHLDDDNGSNSGSAYIYHCIDDLSLPVELSTFTAQFINNVPTLYWVTQSETDNIGWYVYRNEEEVFSSSQKITDEMIQGNGTTTEPSYYIYNDTSENIIIGQTYWYWLESIDLGGESHYYNQAVNITIPDITEDPTYLEPPVVYELQSSPNPTKSSAHITFTLNKSAFAEVSIYNILGELVKTLPMVITTENEKSEVYWNGKDEDGNILENGIYLYQLKVDGNQKETKTLILMR